MFNAVVSHSTIFAHMGSHTEKEVSQLALQKVKACWMTKVLEIWNEYLVPLWICSLVQGQQEGGYAILQECSQWEIDGMIIWSNRKQQLSNLQWKGKDTEITVHCKRRQQS